MRDKQEVFTADEVCGILIEHGQHDDRFKLGETIRYSPYEVLGILTKQTNGDRIRSMTDEKLAHFMVIQAIMGAISVNGIQDKAAADKIVKEIIMDHKADEDISDALRWLKQEAKEDGQGENPATV